ncbi:hypothetical protein SSS_02504 [Sarcoptes scabiei]|nr:hypothetical protein SSS_02504 [Sarcoptes scabiei]
MERIIRNKTKMRPSPSSSSSSLSMGLLASMVLVCSLSNLFVRIDFCEAQNSFVPSNQASVPNEGQDSTKIEENLLSFSNVIDWVFGEPDEEHQKHELEEHFGFIRGGEGKTDVDLAKLANKIGIKPEFFNFKAHDYDNNDRIDGLELMNMIVREKSSLFDDSKNPLQFKDPINVQKRMEFLDLCSNDRNNDGYLDFTEYSKARSRFESIH